EEISGLVRRSGGVPVCVPAVRERRRPAGREVAALLDEAQGEASPVFVFATGVGASALFDEARALGRGAELRDAILRGLAVCRGRTSSRSWSADRSRPPRSRRRSRREIYSRSRARSAARKALSPRCVRAS